MDKLKYIFKALLYIFGIIFMIMLILALIGGTIVSIYENLT